MVYAPIVIPTLNRYVHLKRCIESLAKCPEAKETELYLGLDYPPSDKYIEGYEQILNYVNSGIEGFKNIVVVKREQNLGALRNARALRDMIYIKYDRYIYTEDDNEFASCFLSYMNEALNRYKDDKSIFCVYAAKPAVKDVDSVGTSAFLTTYFSAYGTGFWRDKDRVVLETVNRDYIEDLCCSRSKLLKLKRVFPNSITFLCSALLRKESVYCIPDGTIPIIDTVLMIYSIVEDEYIVCSPFPMVKNWGYDGSGVNCQKQVYTPISMTSFETAEHNTIVFDDNIKKLELNYPLERNRIIPYISALVRIWLWRIIAKRKVHK